MKQKTFNYNLPLKDNIYNFYVSNSNKDAYNYIINETENINYCIIKGPKKCGKTHLGKIWKSKNTAIDYDLKNSYSINLVQNIFIDNFLDNLDEEKFFHLINHCFDNKLKILLSTDKDMANFNFLLSDLSSRLKTFNFLSIDEPDDELIFNITIKLLLDKQIIIKNPDVIHYFLNRIERTYLSINNFINKIDKLSLEKKRELTIPLIKELIY